MWTTPNHNTGGAKQSGGKLGQNIDLKHTVIKQEKQEKTGEKQIKIIKIINENELEKNLEKIGKPEKKVTPTQHAARDTYLDIYHSVQ